VHEVDHLWRALRSSRRANSYTMKQADPGRGWRKNPRWVPAISRRHVRPRTGGACRHGGGGGRGRGAASYSAFGLWPAALEACGVSRPPAHPTAQAMGRPRAEKTGQAANAGSGAAIVAHDRRPRAHARNFRDRRPWPHAFSRLGGGPRGDLPRSPGQNLDRQYRCAGCAPRVAGKIRSPRSNQRQISAH